jgi:hypothetical protein
VKLQVNDVAVSNQPFERRDINPTYCVHMEVQMKTLLVVKALVEIGAGLAFAFVPSWTMSILFGAQLDTAAGVLACRIIGAPIFTLGLACYLTRNDSRSPAATGLVMALLFYDVAFIVMLLVGRLNVGSGIGLWPVVLLHAGLAICSLLCLRKDVSIVRTV